jgi:hypothetical protein
MCSTHKNPISCSSHLHGSKHVHFLVHVLDEVGDFKMSLLVERRTDREFFVRMGEAERQDASPVSKFNVIAHICHVCAFIHAISFACIWGGAKTFPQQACPACLSVESTPQSTLTSSAEAAMAPQTSRVVSMATAFMFVSFY